METPTLDSWKGIVSNYLKAENLKEEEGSFVAEDVQVRERQNDEGEMRAQIEISTTVDEIEYVFALNYTNAKFVKSQVSAPKQLVGKRLFYEKIQVRNPKTNKTVDGISIVKIE